MKDSGKIQSPLSETSPPAKHKKSRFFLKLFLGLTSLFALLIILLLSVDLNTFREPVAKALSQATGMKIKIDFLGWSFSEGLKINCRGVQIFSGETEEELLSTKELRISLNWLPLLEWHVVIDSISLVEPVLKVAIQLSSVNDPLPQLKKTSGSDSNSSSLSLKEPSSPDKLQTIREFLKNPNFSLTAINLIAGRVFLQDKETGKKIALGMDARIQVLRNEKRVGLVLEGIKLAMGNLIAEGEIRADDFLSANSPLQAHILLNPFKVSDLLPVIEWVSKSRHAIYRKLKLKGDIHTLDLKLKTPIDSLMDLDSLMSSADAALILKGKEISLFQYGNTISASTLDTDILWKDRQWKHKIVLGVLGGRIKTQGQVALIRGSKGADDWNLDSNLILEKIDLRELKTRFFGQTAQFPESGMVSAKFQVQGPALHPKLIRGKGSLSAQDLAIPVNGTVLSVVHLEGNGNWLGNQLNHQVAVSAFGGKVSMKGKLNFKKNNAGELEPSIDSEITPESIQLAELRPLIPKDWSPERGTLSGKIHIQGPVLRPQLMQAKGTLGVLDTAIRYKEKMIELATIQGTGRWSKYRLTHDLKMNIFDGNVRVKGILKLNKTKQGERNPVIDSDVISQSVQLSGIRPWVQQNWFPDKGTLTTDVHVQGPVLTPQAIQAKGKIGILDSALRFQEVSIPLTAIHATGQWFNNRLTHDVRMKVFGGNINIKGFLTMGGKKKKEQKLMVDFDVLPQSIQLSKLQPLVQKQWFPSKGTLTGKINIQGDVLQPDSVKSQGSLRLTSLAVKVKESSILVPLAELKGTWERSHLIHDLKLNIFGGNVFIKGNLNFKKNKQGELDPAIDSKVHTQSIQLARLRPLIKNDMSPKEGTLTGSVDLKGPVKRFSEMHFQGNFSGEKVVLAIAEIPVVIQATVLSFEPNTQNNMLVGFNLKDIAIGKLSLKQSNGIIELSENMLKLKKGKVFPNTGVMLLKGTYQINTKGYDLDFSGEGMRLEEFKKEVIEGPLSLKGKLHGTVLPEGFKKGLSGHIEIISETGRILKARGILANILSLLNLDLLSKVGKGLPFDFMGGNYLINNGVLSTRNFKMHSPSLKLYVSGKADLSAETLRAEVVALPLRMTDKVFGKLDDLIAKSQLESEGKGLLHKSIEKVPLIGEALTGTKDEEGLADKIFQMVPLLGNKRKKDERPKGLMKVYFSIDGTFNDPKVYFLPEKTFMLK